MSKEKNVGGGAVADRRRPEQTGVKGVPGTSQKTNGTERGGMTKQLKIPGGVNAKFQKVAPRLWNAVHQGGRKRNTARENENGDEKDGRHGIA